MKLRLATRSDLEDRYVVVGVFADEPAEIEAGENALREAVRRAGAGFDARPGSHVEAPFGRRGWVRLDGLGKREELERRSLIRWLARTGADGRGRRESGITVVVPRHAETAGAAGVLRVVDALVRGAYRFDDYRRADPESPRPLDRIAVVPPAEEKRSYRRELQRAAIVADGVRWARDLGNTPPNVATPEWMAGQARRLARRLGLEVEVLGPSELKRRKLGGILAVGGGSAHPPRLVRLAYGSRGPKVALVGKGVTFDTGGISIKPSASMEEMKYDKCGACAVMGIVQATAELELPLRLTAWLPFAENMPDGASYRPSDIVRCHDGTTVEIVNTDAEGRMLLGDALSLARGGRPEYLVDYATLTGACVVALGEGAAGLFTEDDELAEQLLGAAEGVGERLWRLPLWSEYREEMKGEHADLKNSGGRWGGACTAAAFLSGFAGRDSRWAHIDLAGPAYAKSAASLGQAGASGYGVALSVAWLRELAARGSRRGGRSG